MFGLYPVIQIVSVKPVPSERPEFVDKKVPGEISSFYQTNEVDTFQFDRPYHRADKDKNNEFKVLKWGHHHLINRLMFIIYCDNIYVI